MSDEKHRSKVPLFKGDLGGSRVEIYRLGKLVEKLTSPEQLLGEDVLVGFILDLKNIFNLI